MSAPTAFFDKTYKEAFALLLEARDYVAAAPTRDRAPHADIWDRALIAVETMRLTARLGHVMAWLLARRAVHAGELTAAEAARPPYALERDETLTAAVAAPDALPARLESLRSRSERLYVRVARLDELARRGGIAG